jgi:hypothetical protein
MRGLLSPAILKLNVFLSEGRGRLDGDIITPEVNYALRSWVVLALIVAKECSGAKRHAETAVPLFRIIASLVKPARSLTKRRSRSGSVPLQCASSASAKPRLLSRRLPSPPTTATRQLASSPLHIAGPSSTAFNLVLRFADVFPEFAAEGSTTTSTAPSSTGLGLHYRSKSSVPSPTSPRGRTQNQRNSTETGSRRRRQQEPAL